jgi:hypothetical protein
MKHAIVVLLLCSSVFAKQRDWKDAMVTDQSTPSGAGMRVADGVWLTPVNSTAYWVVTKDLNILLSTPKPINITVKRRTRVALDGGNGYLIDDHGKEKKLRVDYTALIIVFEGVISVDSSQAKDNSDDRPDASVKCGGAAAAAFIDENKVFNLYMGKVTDIAVLGPPQNLSIQALLLGNRRLQIGIKNTGAPRLEFYAAAEGSIQDGVVLSAHGPDNRLYVFDCALQQ